MLPLIPLHHFFDEICDSVKFVYCFFMHVVDEFMVVKYYCIITKE